MVMGLLVETLAFGRLSLLADPGSVSQSKHEHDSCLINYAHPGVSEVDLLAHARHAHRVSSSPVPAVRLRGTGVSLKSSKRFASVASSVVPRLSILFAPPVCLCTPLPHLASPLAPPGDSARTSLVTIYISFFFQPSSPAVPPLSGRGISFVHAALFT